MSVSVLDSWALLSWLQDEAAGAAVRALLEQAERGQAELAMSWMNLGEVYYLLAKRAGRRPAEQFLAAISDLPLAAVLPDRDLIVAAAQWKSRHPIAYADAFAIATAERLGASLVTGDPELRFLNHAPGFRLHWLGA